MLMVLFLLSMTGDDAPRVTPPPSRTVAAQPRSSRCENARGQLVREGEGPAPSLRSLDKEPQANAYRPVVRYAHCDKPVVIAKGIGKQQR